MSTVLFLPSFRPLSLYLACLSPSANLQKIQFVHDNCICTDIGSVRYRTEILSSFCDLLFHKSQKLSLLQVGIVQIYFNLCLKHVTPVTLGSNVVKKSFEKSFVLTILSFGSRIRSLRVTFVDCGSECNITDTAGREAPLTCNIASTESEGSQQPSVKLCFQRIN